MSDPAEQPVSGESSRDPQDSQHGASPTQPHRLHGARSASQNQRSSRASPTPQDQRSPQSCSPSKRPKMSPQQQQTQDTTTRQQTQGTTTRQQTQGTTTRQQTQGTTTGQQTQATTTRQQTQSIISGHQDQGTSTGQQQTQSTNPGRQQTRGASTRQQQPQVAEAETYWRQSVRDWYPNLHGQTYFLPPSYFNRVPYDVQTVAGQSVLVPQKASDQPHQVPVLFNPSGPLPPPEPAHLASRVWPDQAVPPGLLSVVPDNYVRDDRAMQLVLDCIRGLAERERLVMLVLFQLQFRKYLDNQVGPINAAAIHLLPQFATLGQCYADGDFDVLMINERYGLIVGEVKSVGADPSKIPDQDNTVVKVVGKAVKQVNKQATVLRHLVSDLQSVKVTKTLMLPNITSTQLLQALSTDPQLQQALCQCVEVVVTDPAAAVARCLTADTLVASSQWWQRAVTYLGPDSNMTADLYEVLVARFCGPATTIEVPTVTTPRRSVPLRTMSEAVALTGLTTAMLTLYPEQVELVNRSGLPRVFLWGPPGTGKTVILVIKGLQWGHQEKDVHLLSTHRHSRAVNLLIESQLQHILGGGSTPTSTPTSGPRVYIHFYDFEDDKEDLEAAAEELASAARDGELFVIADEAFNGFDSEDLGVYTRGRFAAFCTHLAARIPALHLWAAAVERDVTPPCLCVETVTTPLRCPPAVVREVEVSEWIERGTVPRFTGRPAPAPTDGPAVRVIRHWEEDRVTLLPGHTGDRSEYCEGCAGLIAHLMEELGVGQPGRDLQYRDTFILCHDPRDDMPVVTYLRAHNVPVQVVTSRDDEAAIREVALPVRDTVTVTDCDVVCGLERRVVIVVGLGETGVEDDFRDRVHAMSRCTALLVWVGEPKQSDDDDADADDDDDDGDDDDDDCNDDDDDDGVGEEEDGVV